MTPALPSGPRCPWVGGQRDAPQPVALGLPPGTTPTAPVRLSSGQAVGGPRRKDGFSPGGPGGGDVRTCGRAGPGERGLGALFRHVGVQRGAGRKGGHPPPQVLVGYTVPATLASVPTSHNQPVAGGGPNPVSGFGGHPPLNGLTNKHHIAEFTTNKSNPQTEHANQRLVVTMRASEDLPWCPASLSNSW